MKKSILVVAGEVSGDLHAAEVVRAARDLSPETAFWGIGGDRLANETARLMSDTPERKTMLEGYAEVRKILGSAAAAAEVGQILRDT